MLDTGSGSGTKSSGAEVYKKDDFFAKIGETLAQPKEERYCLIIIEIENFRLFTRLFGRSVRNSLLSEERDLLCKTAAPRGGVIGSLDSDNFIVLMPDEEALLAELRAGLEAIVNKWGNTIGFPVAMGIYAMGDTAVSTDEMYDNAAMALAEARKQHYEHTCRYTADMEAAIEREIVLLSEIKKGMENGEFTFYAQPQCNIANRKIVGAEALARWVKKDGKTISPGLFVPVLEKNGMIDKLDRIIWEGVCAWLRKWMDVGFEPVPISINVSRLDIMALDVPEYICSLVHKYNIPEKYLKIEITESAYTEEDERISYTINSLRSSGFKILMDDFGSGYSSLNMLKSLPVDVLKLDMRFLDIEDSTTEKGINILESVVNMARLLRLPIIVEGVENKEQEHYVKELGCRYIQGFLYYRPLPISEFEHLIADDRRLDHLGLSYKQVESLHLREFIDSSVISDTVLNNVIGPVVFYEMYDNRISITRANEPYLRLIGNDSGQQESYGQQFWNNVRDDDRALLHILFDNAFRDSSVGARGSIHLLRLDGKCITVDVHLFFLHEKNGRKQFYASLTDVTEYADSLASIAVQRAADRETATTITEDMRKAYDSVPYGIAIQHVTKKPDGTPDFEIVYYNRALGSLFVGNAEQIRQLAMDAFVSTDNSKGEEMLEALYRAAYEGKTSEVGVYSNISNRYLKFSFFRAAHGYAGTVIRDVTDTHINATAFGSIALSYREVYFLQLQSNYYRMLYPDSERVTERGNYSDAINRHFGSRKISSFSEKRVREFLSPESIVQALTGADKTEMLYKRQHHGREEWCLTSITVSERSSDGRPLNAIMVIKSVDALMKRSENDRSKYLSDALYYMSDSFFIYHGEGDEKLIYANNNTAALFGCKSIDEFRTYVNDSFKGMVHPEDLKRIESEIEDHISTSVRNMDYIRYRIIRKDGEIRWIDDIGHFEAGPDGVKGVYYVFLNDITDTITPAQKQQLLARNMYYADEK